MSALHIRAHTRPHHRPLPGAGQALPLLPVRLAAHLPHQRFTRREGGRHATGWGEGGEPLRP